MAKNKCKKCGGKDISKMYHKGKSDCSYYESIEKGTDREHLHYHCRICHYSWTGKVKNKDK